MQTNQLLAALAAHRAFDAEEETHRARIAAFVARESTAWWQRATAEGHITASAWIVDAARTHALLLHHAKLDCWVQPGGHLDATDDDPAAGALREAREETGLSGLALESEALFDVDVHHIPARAGDRPEPAHLHYDLRYLIISPDSAVRISDESLGARWVRMTELTMPGIERSIARMAEKFLADEHT